MIKIIIADDHRIYLDGLKALLDKQKNMLVLGEASNWPSLLSLVNGSQPDVIVTDLKMPGCEPLMGVQSLFSLNKSFEILALSMLDDISFVEDLLKEGVKGYVLKSADNLEIINGIEHLYDHQHYHCDNVTKKLNSQSREKGNSIIPYFTEKEKQIIRLICEEYSSKEIAKQLFTSLKNVEWHRNKIIAKMQVKNVAGIVRYAIDKALYRLLNNS